MTTLSRCLIEMSDLIHVLALLLMGLMVIPVSVIGIRWQRFVISCIEQTGVGRHWKLIPKVQGLGPNAGYECCFDLPPQNYTIG